LSVDSLSPKDRKCKSIELIDSFAWLLNFVELG